MASGVRKSCLFYVQNISWIQPLLTNFTTTPIAQENSPLPLMLSLVYSEHNSQSNHLKTWVISHYYSHFSQSKNQNSALASRALRDLFPCCLYGHLAHFHACLLCSSHRGLSAVLWTHQTFSHCRVFTFSVTSTRNALSSDTHRALFSHFFHICAQILPSQ